MIEYALMYAFAMVAISLVMNLWRLAVGPTVMDRVLAGDTMVVNTIAIIILYGIQNSTTYYFESALLLAMFSFISTVAYCRFQLRGDIVE
jgi:multicomponent K+:H+ antiporter subunit F